MKYLFLVAHIDDAEISCGGLIAKLIERGDFVHVLSLTDTYNDINLYDEFEASMKLLDVDIYQTDYFKTRKLNQFPNEIADLARYWVSGFDYVFTHSVNDRHDDHRTVAEQVRRVVNGNLITFMTPCNGTEDSNYFVELNDQQLEKKLEAVACYRSQIHRPYMQPDFIRAQAIYNGVKCGKQYAEGYHIIRKLE
jgi:LmbE family N-acetylglucosaminyl deacetylase